MKTLDIGYINKNNQKNLGYRGKSETHYNQRFFEMENNSLFAMQENSSDDFVVFGKEIGVGIVLNFSFQYSLSCKNFFEFKYSCSDLINST